MDVSHAVNAYKASMVLSGEISLGKWTKISTADEVLSSTRLTLILPCSFAFRILSIREEVLVLKGISLITKVFLSN